MELTVVGEICVGHHDVVAVAVIKLAALIRLD